MNIKLIIICLLALPLYSLGQTISGKVVLEQSEKPVSEVMVILDGSDYEFTSLYGSFSLSDVSAGEHTLEFSSVGYKSVFKTVTVGKDESSFLKVELNEAIIDLKGVTIQSFSTVGGYLGSLDLPPSSNYISKKELDQLNTTDIHKVLMTIPGVSVQEEDGFGLRPNIGLRGSGAERSSKITLMEDEVLAAPAPYAAPSAYYFPTVGRMSAVEVRKGSSQIQYGPYTTGGVLNFVSTPVPSSFQGTIRGNFGEFDTKNLSANIGGKTGQFSYLAETFQYNSNGFKNLPNEQQTGFDKQDYLAKVKWESKENSSTPQSLQFKFGYADETSNETYLGLTASDFASNPNSRYAGSAEDVMKTDHQQYVLTHFIQPGKSLSLKTSVYNNDFHRNWYKLDKVANISGESVGISTLLSQPGQYSEQLDIVKGNVSTGSTSVLDVKANNRTYYSRGIQTRMNLSLGAADEQSLEVGARFHTDQMDRYQWVDGYSINNGTMALVEEGAPGSNSNRLETARAFSTYAQYEFQWKDFTFLPGARFESINIEREDFGKEDPQRTGVNLATRENDVQEFIPGLSFRYQFNDQHQLFSGVHKGFAPPGSKPETNSEESVNYELGYRFQTNTSFASIVGYYNDYSNLLGADNLSSGGTGSGDLFNGGEARTFGLELAGQSNVVLTDRIYLPLHLAYTYTNAAFSSSFNSEFSNWGNVTDGDELPYVAPHQLNASAGVKSKRLSAFLRGNFVDEMRVTPGQGSYTPENSIDSRFLLNADASFQLNKHFSILGKVNNLFDEDYVVAQRPSGLRPGLPQLFSLGVDVQF